VAAFENRFREPGAGGARRGAEQQCRHPARDAAAEREAEPGRAADQP
jgi:hypothetical protein